MSPTEHTLKDGSIVTIRPISPEDREELLRGFRALSPESRYHRFLSHRDSLTEAELRYLTDVDGVNHVALVAVVPSLDLRSERGVGVARFIRLKDEPHVAEAAITVSDDFQGRGLGRLLLRQLVEAAQRADIQTFRAEVLAENAPMVHILRDAGARVVEQSGPVLVLDVPTSADEGEPASAEQGPLFRVLRAIAGTFSSFVSRARISPDAEPVEVTIGIDLGGTKTEAAVVRRRGRDIEEILLRRRIPTDVTDYEAVLSTVAALIDDVARETSLDVKEIPIGIGMPGAISQRTGLVKNANTTCLNHRPFRADLVARLGRPVAFDNDANCFALAETRLGAARAFADQLVFGVIAGTGVGGGIVTDGRVWRGAQGIAGEWGHHAVWPDRSEPCYCGKRGCIELFLSGPGVERAYFAAAKERLSLAEIVSRRDTDPRAAAAIEDLLLTFGRGLANVINILDPAAIVLGGGVSNLDILYTEGRSRVASFVFNDELTTPILRPTLGDSAGVLGAALIAISPNAKEQPSWQTPS